MLNSAFYLKIPRDVAEKGEFITCEGIDNVY